MHKYKHLSNKRFNNKEVYYNYNIVIRIKSTFTYKNNKKKVLFFKYLNRYYNIIFGILNRGMEILAEIA